ncbi:hypothetical protein ULO1_26100, partial [Carboxydocella sp. ULO1]
LEDDMIGVNMNGVEILRGVKIYG